MTPYMRLAEKLLFVGTKDLSKLLVELGLEYRKDKTADDVRRKVQRGVRMGHGRVEHELSMVEVYLKDVLKVVRQRKSVSV